MSTVAKIREKMSEAGLDAILVSDELNQHYLSGFAFTDGYLFITHEKAYLVTDFRYFEMAENRAYPEFIVVMPESRREFLTQVIEEGGVKTLGFEGSYLPYAEYRAYVERYPGVEFVDIKTIIEDMRYIKTPEEIAKMQKAQDITDKAFSQLLSVITTNMTEIEVAAELEYAMRRLGADSAAFETIAVTADASALPHGTPRNLKLRQGFLTMDFGAKVGGYCSDMTRTIVIGKADSDMKKLYNTVLSAQLAALDFLKEGADAGEADKIARDIIDKDYNGTFGHGVGLFIHENPRLSRTAFGYKLRKGEIVTVEPGIYLYGKYGCRIEDMVAIEEGGVHNFTHSTKELIEI